MSRHVANCRFKDSLLPFRTAPMQTSKPTFLGHQIASLRLHIRTIETRQQANLNSHYRKGRKPVLWLSLIGIMISSLWVVGVLALGQSVSIYVVLFSPAFAIIGGGGTVLVSAIYSAVADVVSEADR